MIATADEDRAPTLRGRRPPGVRDTTDVALSRPRPLSVPVALLVTFLALSGCSLVGSSPAHEVRQAFVSTVSAGPARVAVSSRTDVAGQSVEVTGEGVLDVPRQAADLQLQVPALGAVRTVIVDGTAYAELPALVTAFLPGATAWGSIDLDRLATEQFGVPLTQLGTTNPFEQLGYLEGVRDDAREVGREPVEGVETTRYAASIDLDATPAAQDPETRPAVDRLRETLGTSVLPVEVWIDDDGRVRRASQTVVSPAEASGAGAPTGATSSITFREFGVETDIVAPPPDQVADLDSLLPTG